MMEVAAVLEAAVAALIRAATATAPHHLRHPVAHMSDRRPSPVLHVSHHHALLVALALIAFNAY
jgi:uncharacterized protein (DUF2384 family)